MPGPEYSTCVDPKDYSDYSWATVLLGGWWEATDYMLHRKLVCLGSVQPQVVAGVPRLTSSGERATSCAIGRIVSFEPPSSKSGFDAIDNDFSFNILLRPTDELPDLSDDPFSGDAWLKKTEPERLDAVRRGYQGEFLVEQNTPRPHEADDDDPRYGGYNAEMFYDKARMESGTAAVILANRFVWYRDGSLATYPATDNGAFNVPVLHCECEGSRIRDVFNVADQMPGGGAGCKKHWWTRIGCFILHMLFLPFTTTFIAEAWANARDGNYHDAMDGNGELHVGDLVLVTGRWVFDAGHKGHNELHAVRTIQKIQEGAGAGAHPSDPPPGSPPQAFDAFYRSWCGLSSEAPPDHKGDERPVGMTATQTAVFDAQQRPENHYELHPDIDGCLPDNNLKLAAVEPNEVARLDGDREITLLGTGFQAGATVTIRSPSIPVKATVFESATKLRATVSLARDTLIGKREVVVTNPDLSTASCECLSIYERPDIR